MRKRYRVEAMVEVWVDIEIEEPDDPEECARDAEQLAIDTAWDTYHDRLSGWRAHSFQMQSAYPVEE